MGKTEAKSAERQSYVQGEGWSAYWAAAKLNIYGIGLLALWTTVNTVLLPKRIDATAPASLRTGALGVVSLVGVGAAVFVQPWAGQLSDRAPINDRRRWFIAVGTVGMCGFLVLFGWSPGFGLLLAAYVLLQVSSNVAQAAFQAFIPDFVSQQARGLASGVKNALSVLGAAVGLGVARGTLSIDSSGHVAVVILAVLVAVLALLTYLWVPPTPPPDAKQRADSLSELVNPSGLWHTFKTALRKRPIFRAAVIAQLLFMLALYPVQRYLVYFLEDRFGKSAAAGDAAIGAAVGIICGAVAAALAGTISDHIGRLPVLFTSVILAVAGLIGFAVLPSLPLIALCGILLAIGLGSFLATNWALMTEHLPHGNRARALGVANVATAGAGALAGLFGLLVNLLQSGTNVDAYTVVYGICALIAVAAFWPLSTIRRETWR